MMAVEVYGERKRPQPLFPCRGREGALVRRGGEDEDGHYDAEMASRLRWPATTSLPLHPTPL